MLHVLTTKGQILGRRGPPYSMVAGAGFEPVCLSLIKQVLILMSLPAIIRGGQCWIRTSDLFHVKEALYQLS